VNPRLPPLWQGAAMNIASAALGLLLAGPAFADAPDVVDAIATEAGGRWTVTVTIAHHDTGWDHFAKGFAVLLPDGTRLAYLEFSHPHIGQDTFAASLTGLRISNDVPFLLIRTRCNLVGWAAEPVQIDLPR
jgi:hypothetical protein